MVHDDERAAAAAAIGRWWVAGSVDPNDDLGAVARRDLQVFLADLLRDRTRHVPQVVLLPQRRGAVRAPGGEVVPPVVRVRWLGPADRVPG